jgi:hypothetical protein
VLGKRLQEKFGKIGVTRVPTLFNETHPSYSESSLLTMPTRVLADWLVLSIRSHLLGGQGMQAYGDSASTILRGEDLPHGLMLLAESKGEVTRTRFVAACPRAIESLDFTRDADLRIADVLLRFALNVGATGTLEVLARKAGTVSPDEWPDDFFQLSLQLARTFPSRDGASASVLLRHLIASKQKFPVLQVGQTLEALAVAAPEQFADHWTLLAKPLEAKFGTLNYICQERQEERRYKLRDDLLERLIAHVPDKGLLLLDAPDTSGSIVEAPQWWRDTLMRSSRNEIGRLMQPVPPMIVVDQNASNTSATLTAPSEYDPQTRIPHLEDTFDEPWTEATPHEIGARLGFDIPVREKEAA